LGLFFLFSFFFFLPFFFSFLSVLFQNFFQSRGSFPPFFFIPYYFCRVGGFLLLGQIASRPWLPPLFFFFFPFFFFSFFPLFYRDFFDYCEELALLLQDGGSRGPLFPFPFFFFFCVFCKNGYFFWFFLARCFHYPFVSFVFPSFSLFPNRSAGKQRTSEHSRRMRWL